MTTLAIEASGTTSEDRTDITRIAGMLAHELRNPLASAATNLAVVTDLCDESDPRVPFLRRAEHEMDRIRVLLRSCLDLACAGRIDRRRSAVHEILGSALRASGSSDAVHVDLELEPSLEADVDPVLVARAVENVLENSVRAIGAGGGRILVSAALRGDRLQIVIEDDGPGITPELEESIFEPFVTGSRGSGLGLAFVRRVAEAHGGRVRAGRSELGGARFEIEVRTGG